MGYVSNIQHFSILSNIQHFSILIFPVLSFFCPGKVTRGLKQPHMCHCLLHKNSFTHNYFWPCYSIYPWNVREILSYVRLLSVAFKCRREAVTVTVEFGTYHMCLTMKHGCPFNHVKMANLNPESVWPGNDTAVREQQKYIFGRNHDLVPSSPWNSTFTPKTSLKT